MRIKILILPFLIILSLILAIGFIKPDYMSLMQKRATLEQKQNQVTSVEGVKANIDTLYQELSNKEELKTFVERQHPETMDQERVIDSFNFMATQAGLVIETMEMKEIVLAKAEEPLGIGGPLTSVPTDTVAGEAGASPAVAAFVRPEASSYVARVQVKGGYENIKNFMTRLSRMDRVNNLTNLSIATDTREETTTEGDTQSSAGQLIGVFEARFDYLESPKGKNALDIPLFAQSSLSVGKLEEVKSWSNASVPTLTVGEAGKANPFQ